MRLSGHLLAVAPGAGWKPIAEVITRNGLIAAATILVLFLAMVGGYYCWRRRRARRQRQTLSSAIEAQATLAPKTLSDPNQRAALDKLRQRFQAGLQEFQSRGKDIFRLPWYLIIGEPGSGKTEAIRHSGIEFPPGLQNELQGSGGTVNMDWWFSNQAVILDTAGRLLFNESPPGESPEWSEFLRLLKKARFHCPINGLFVVLSIESLIKDSAEQIVHKARRLAQQLDLIQRTLDVRFPVYLLVTKADLLAGFREFYDSMDDPLLRHQMFGWSNPEPLDAPFRPELVSRHLESVAERLRSRRLALLRVYAERRLHSSSPASATSDLLGSRWSGLQRSDDAEALFALPASMLRLAPRLHRYLQTIFTAGEWSPRPVFLRGIYFTSSMVEGRTLDEAIAFATGLSLEQLPEDSNWEKSRAYFLRDLFTEKVFRESGLVTRAANTVSLLRRRRLAILGAGTVAALTFLGFAGYGYGNLKQAILDEADFWSLGARNASNSSWSPPIVAARDDNLRIYTYRGDAKLEAPGQPTLVQYHARLKELAEQEPAGGLVFKPIALLLPGGLSDRPLAQRVLLERWVLEPMVHHVRAKMSRTSPAGPDTGPLFRHKDAWLALIQLEGDALVGDFLDSTNGPQKYVHNFFSYLTESDFRPDPMLVQAIAGTYAKPARARNAGRWPPLKLPQGDTLVSNRAIAVGLTNFHSVSLQVEKGILQRLSSINDWVDRLRDYAEAERIWLTDSADPCFDQRNSLLLARLALVEASSRLRAMTNASPVLIADLESRYVSLETVASSVSPAALLGPVKQIAAQLPETAGGGGLFPEVQAQINRLAFKAPGEIRSSYYQRRAFLPSLDREQLIAVDGRESWDVRWSLYTSACALDSIDIKLSTNDIGEAWNRMGDWTNKVAQCQADLVKYTGPLKNEVSNACGRVILGAASNFKGRLAREYAQLVTMKLAEAPSQIRDLPDLVFCREWLGKVQRDLEKAGILGDHAKALAPVQESLAAAKKSTLVEAGRYYRRQIGFPVVPSASETMDAKSLVAAKRLLQRLATELSDPLWRGHPSNAQELSELRQELRRYGTIMESLVNKNDSIAEVEIAAFPYEKLNRPDKDVVGAFRWVAVGDTPGASTLDLTKAHKQPLPVATRPLDQEFTLHFRSDRDVRQQKLPSWWLLRWIAEGHAETLEEGSKWKIKIPIADAGRHLNGNAVFEVRLVGETRLPNREEWGN